MKWHYFADVTLACEDNKGILAHKVLLVSGSGFYRDNNLKMSEGGTSPSAKDKMAHFSEWNVQAQWLARDQGLGSWTTLPRFLLVLLLLLIVRLSLNFLHNIQPRLLSPPLFQKIAPRPASPDAGYGATDRVLKYRTKDEERLNGTSIRRLNEWRGGVRQSSQLKKLFREWPFN